MKSQSITPESRERAVAQAVLNHANENGYPKILPMETVVSAISMATEMFTNGQSGCRAVDAGKKYLDKSADFVVAAVAVCLEEGMQNISWRVGELAKEGLRMLNIGRSSDEALDHIRLAARANALMSGKAH